jgi:hypothetical protein
MGEGGASIASARPRLKHHLGLPALKRSSGGERMNRVTQSRPRATTSLAIMSLLVLIELSWPVATLAQGSRYAFEVIADTRAPGEFSDFGYPVLNSRGDVVFAARLQAGGSGIYKFSAATGTIVTIFEDPTND